MSNIQNLIEQGCCKDCDRDLSKCLLEGDCYYDKDTQKPQHNFVLDIEDVDKNGETFYRYRYQNFLLVFIQRNDNGHIYAVSVGSDKEYPFPFNILADCTSKYYPDKFECRFPSFVTASVSDIEAMQTELQEIKVLLQQLELFFKTSKHAILYEQHNSEK